MAALEADHRERDRRAQVHQAAAGDHAQRVLPGLERARGVEGGAPHRPHRGEADAGPSSARHSIVVQAAGSDEAVTGSKVHTMSKSLPEACTVHRSMGPAVSSVTGSKSS